MTCLVQPPPLPSLPPPPPPAPRDGEVTVGVGVGEAAATAAAAAPAPDVVAVVPGAAASAITVYPTQQWRRNFRDHIIPVRLPGGEGGEARGGVRKDTKAPVRSPLPRVASLSALAARTAGRSPSAPSPPPAPSDWWARQLRLGGAGRGRATPGEPPPPPTAPRLHILGTKVLISRALT